MTYAWPCIRDLHDLDPLTSVHEQAGGAVRFVTSIETAAPEDAPLSEDTISRLIALWVVQRLDGDDLQESCEYLVDNFVWRNKKLNQPTSKPLKMLAAAKNGLTITKAKPITLEE
jgi:hypothetical protein